MITSYGNKAARLSSGDDGPVAWGVAAAIELRPVPGGNTLTVGNRAHSNSSDMHGLAPGMVGLS